MYNAQCRMPSSSDRRRRREIDRRVVHVVEEVGVERQRIRRDRLGDVGVGVAGLLERGHGLAGIEAAALQQQFAFHHERFGVGGGEFHGLVQHGHGGGDIGRVARAEATRHFAVGRSLQVLGEFERLVLGQGDRIVELIRGAQENINIVIKPHPLIGDLFPERLAAWTRLAASERNVFLVEDTHADVMPYLKAADVLVTDVSSVSLEYLALNRPMVLITSPHLRDEAFVDENGLEWRWRDMGEEIFDVTELPRAVASAIDDPLRNAQRRMHYRSLLFGDLTDGRTSQRLAEHVQALAPQAAASAQMAMAAAVGHTTMALVNTRERLRSWRINQ